MAGGALLFSGCKVYEAHGSRGVLPILVHAAGLAGWPFVFMFSVAAIMEAFLSPDMAVAAEALELTVQLALDFVDDLVRLVVISTHCERF